MPLFSWVVTDASHVYNTGIDAILEGCHFGTEDTPSRDGKNYRKHMPCHERLPNLSSRCYKMQCYLEDLKLECGNQATSHQKTAAIETKGRELQMIQNFR
jgi:hypothetical protein